MRGIPWDPHRHLDLSGATVGPLAGARAPQWVSAPPSSGPVTVPSARAHAHGDERGSAIFPYAGEAARVLPTHGGGDGGEKTG